MQDCFGVSQYSGNVVVIKPERVYAINKGYMSGMYTIVSLEKLFLEKKFH